MISTVNISTIATVTTFASAFSLGVMAVFLLLCLLIQKEIVAPALSARADGFNRVLSVAIMPLLITFGLNLLIKLVQIIGFL